MDLNVERLGEGVSFEERMFISEQFLDRYAFAEPRDIYRWVREGEYGIGGHVIDLSLENLHQDLRKARIHKTRITLPVTENLGLANRFVKVNLAPYSDIGCPLKRLLMLEERVPDMRPDPLRFKRDWAFMKTQLSPGMSVTVDMMNRFENEIPFHMIPEIEYSKAWMENYGTGYRIVPRAAFFQYFPEHSIHNGWAPESEVSLDELADADSSY
ncbi:MAG: hypothetical protein K1X75_04935 [Leptospirales bacterium]|nr:hypothetical protein [Leptospirales bacterium]